MFEVLTVITDEHGSRVCPTGKGYTSEALAHQALKRWQAKYPAQAFYVERQPAADEWNSY
jgi:hypothetical protein